MYNHSYKGFKDKSRKRNFRKYGSLSGNSKLNSERGISHLQLIRVIVVILAVILFVGSIALGFIIYGNSKDDFTNSTVYTPVDSNQELLRVVNKNNPVDKDFIPRLKEYEGYSVNTLATADLEKMIADAKNEGVELVVKKAYVSFDDQQKNYNNTYKKYLKTYNLSEVTAQAKAQVVTPKGGESEYQTGLLMYFDTVEKYSSFRETSAYKWLEKNSINYGFVLRYTSEKEGKTSMKPTFHVFRYVGKDNAKLMQSLNMCLDEYKSYLNSR